MVDLWTSIGISPSGSTIIAYDSSNNNIYSYTNATNVFTKSSSIIPPIISVISVIDISYVLCIIRTVCYICSALGMIEIRT